MTDIHQHRILILDYGSQYTQLIARRVREIGAYCEIHSCEIDPAVLTTFSASGIILSGGPESTIEGDSPTIVQAVFDAGVPLLGICYGMQAMARQLGGEVINSGHSEFGYASIIPIGSSVLFDGLNDAQDATEVSLDVWMSHGDRVEKLPDGFEKVASSASAPIAAMADQAKRWFGIQFHPEVTHTLQGLEILRRFVIDVCQCDGSWTSVNIIDDALSRARQQVGSDQVVLGLSGGVDSSVVAALLQRAIGQQLTCVFVDTGLLRLNEGDDVMRTFADNMGVNVIRINAADRFLEALKGQTDPEQKRRTIGNLFVEIFEEEAARLTDACWLAQGTIYPDVIESAGAASGKAHLIKSHHNVGGLPEKMSLKLLEPLRELFKDEVRHIGIELGLPASMVYRHPFPGQVWVCAYWVR